jgi:hypothetical protein
MATTDSARGPGNRTVAARLALLGAIAGALSWVLIDLADELHLHFEVEFLGLMFWPLSLYPGLVFGATFGAALRLWGRRSWAVALGYALASTLGYLAAFHVAFYIVTDGFSDHERVLPYVLGGVPAGLAGSLVLGLLARHLLRVPGRIVLGRPVLVGMLAGALLGLAAFDDHNGWGFLAFFILWQGAYGASLAPLFARQSAFGGRPLSGS